MVVSNRNKFGDLFYHDKYGEDTALLRSAIYEIAEHLGHTLENPISISVLCMQFMMPAYTCYAIYQDILTLILNDENNKTPKLESFSQIEEIALKHFPEPQQLSEIELRAFVKAMAKCSLPELQPYLEKLLKS